ncbi:hypothetical protein TRVA0_026S01486 [Trichomonascus vanleenenianus]|uniref:uncharacterized protein n=1 Tax=Trichomonascus vanleenenianus TaxID=2268995 RepID=UPI003EC9E18C
MMRMKASDTRLHRSRSVPAKRTQDEPLADDVRPARSLTQTLVGDDTTEGDPSGRPRTAEEFNSSRWTQLRKRTRGRFNELMIKLKLKKEVNPRTPRQPTRD